MPGLETDRLDGWKEIAEFLGVTVRSAQRYEETGGLPIHRLPVGGRVYAHIHELQVWRVGGGINERSDASAAELSSRPFVADKEASAALPPSSAGEQRIRLWRSAALTVGALLVVAAMIAVWFPPFRSKPRIVGSVRLTHTGLFKRALATDGQRLYFFETEGNRSKLFQVSVTGGEPAEIPTPFQDIAGSLDISPDGTKLLMSAGTQDEPGLWVFQLPSGPARRVYRGTEPFAPSAWRPHTQGIVYSDGKELFQTDAYGMGATKLAGLLGQPDNLIFSPDGSSLRFDLVDGATTDRSLWEASPEGKNARRLPISIATFGGRWTPDGRYFLWITSQGGIMQLWARRETRGMFWRRGQAEHLSASVLSDIYCVLPSKDGRKLFVIAGGEGSPRLLHFDPKSGHIAPLYKGMAATELDFSRDGQWITYVDLHTSCLWRMREDGTERLQLTFSPMLVMLPHWSPDGRQIAFTAKTPEKPWAIHTVASDGGPLHRLTYGESQAGSPTWSLDGKAIVFGDILCEAGTCAIRRLDLASGNVTTLPGSQGMRTARWSPDGRYIAALDLSAQKAMVYELATSRWEQLVHGPIGDILCWSPDSQYVYYGLPVGSDAAVFRVQVRSRKLDKVVSLVGRPEILGCSLNWFGLCPDGSIALVSDARDWDIYALDWESP